MIYEDFLLIKDETAQDIADGLRQRLGITDEIQGEDFADLVDSIDQTHTDMVEAFITGPKTFSYYENARITDALLGGGFQYATNLQSVSFPNCKKLGDAVFAYCSGLKSLYIPQVTELGVSAFQNCSSLSEFVNDSVLTMSSYVFWQCTNLKKFSCHNLSKMGMYAFYQCAQCSIIDLPNLVYADKQAFQTCTGLTTANIPKLNELPYVLFGACSKLISVNLSPNLTLVSSGAFNGCQKLSNIYMENLSSSIRFERSAFQKCYNLLSLTINTSNLCPLVSIDAFKSTPISNYTTSTGGVYGSIYVPASLVAAYKTASNWSVYSNRITAL